MTEIPAQVRDRVGILATDRLSLVELPISAREADPRLNPERERLGLELERLAREHSCSPGEAFRILRDQELPGWTDPLLATSDDEAISARGRSLFNELRTKLQRHISFPERWEYDIAALYVFQCHLTDLLPGFFYVFLDGTKGTGKTTALDHISRLTGSLRLQSFTLATLSRSMAKFFPVSIDEYDEVEKDPELGGAISTLVRQGYKRDAPPRKVCAPKSNAILDLEIAGPKALTFRGDIDDALKDRGFRLPMERGGGTFDMVLLGMAPEFGDLPERLAEWSESAHRVWTFSRVAGRLKDPQLASIVIGTLGGPAATRDAELLTTAILVSEIVGLDVRGSLRAALSVKGREEGESRPVEDLLEALRTVVERSPAPLSQPEIHHVLQSEVRKEIDRARKERRAVPIKQPEFSRARKDAGVRDDWRVSIRGKDHWKVPKSFLESRIEAPEAPETPSIPDAGVPGVPRVPHFGGYGDPSPCVDPDPEDLFRGQTTRADRARNSAGDGT